ncbi:hypothetical protein NM208_g7222 [Fusarium decemcellulare]|uniref:Uncharacterized protein n=1 Tax=Fusarium decemcellulare TaxID=57161 RepID=A0ACC1SA12_9HYPO|nr:hypothetical protein NM208_g7222 [Fusarium decemcellulare]
MSTSPATVETTIPFLARDKRYNEEKPYGADFPIDNIEGAKITNHVFETHPVTVYDVRTRDEPLDLERNGSCFIKAKTSLMSQEASRTKTPPMTKYIDEVIDVLRRNFPQYLRHRSPSFPDGHGEPVEFAQPATLPHTDFSISGAFMRMEEVFPGNSDDYKGRNFDLINVWRVLAGPNDDWPLAVCDYLSVDIEHDITTNDALHLTRVGENWLLYRNQAHRWYYLSAMEEDDLIVFRNTDSMGKLSRM